MEIRTEWIMPGTGAIAAAVTALVFGGFWLGLRRHRLKKKNGAGGWLNALGFGVLPGLMVWKTFEQYLDTGSAGKPLFEPLKATPWLTASGRFFPARIELALFMLLFLGICAWLMIRKNDLRGNGDLAGIVTVLWAAGRTVTEGFRTESQISIGEWRAVYLIGIAVTLFWLAVWTGRRQKRNKKTGQRVADWLAVIGLCGALWAMISGTISVGSEIGDLAVITGCSAARAAIVLAVRPGESRQ